MTPGKLNMKIDSTLFRIKPVLINKNPQKFSFRSNHQLENDVFISSNKGNIVSVLEETYKVSDDLDKLGMIIPDISRFSAHLKSEVDEFKQAVNNGNRENQIEEMGDILFMSLRLARSFGIKPEEALDYNNKKLKKRINLMEQITDKPVELYNYDDLLKIWNKAKNTLKSNTNE